MNIMTTSVCFTTSKVNMSYRRELNIFFVLVINLSKMSTNKYTIHNINPMPHIDDFAAHVVSMVESIHIIY